eukprot:jgi/Tetstr1/422204/TSEL_013056.t1
MAMPSTYMRVTAPTAARRAALPARPALKAARLSKSSFSGAALTLRVPAPTPARRAPAKVEAVARPRVAAAAPDLDPLESAAAKIVGAANAPSVVTVGFIAIWYALNIGFNLINKSIFNYFPFPWTVSTVHVVVGAVYCMLAYAVGAKKASFERPITKDEFKLIFPPAFMHAAGHVAANLSFAAVAISLTHTVKTLEPVFSVALSYLFMGTVTPLPVLATLIPIMAGVSYASAADLSFNWQGFNTAMISNLTFGFRAVLSKQNMKNIKQLGSTGIYAWTTLISALLCIPGTLYFEGPRLQAGIEAAVAKVGATTFYCNLLAVGLLYHLYNQFAFNTLGRVSPVSHGVCNVVKRVAIIVTSVIFFGTPLTMKTKIGTGVALLGTYLYTQATAKAAAKPKAA